MIAFFEFALRDFWTFAGSFALIALVGQIVLRIVCVVALAARGGLKTEDAHL